MRKYSKERQSKLVDRGSDLVLSGQFWTQWVEPRSAALLSQMLGPVYFVVKNHGPHSIWLVAHYGDLKEIPPGAVRATYARGTITIENRGDKAVLIEFQFLAVLLKH